jgi:hypothetical protein
MEDAIDENDGLAIAYSVFGVSFLNTARMETTECDPVI